MANKLFFVFLALQYFKTVSEAGFVAGEVGETGMLTTDRWAGGVRGATVRGVPRTTTRFRNSGFQRRTSQPVRSTGFQVTSGRSRGIQRANRGNSGFQMTSQRNTGFRRTGPRPIGFQRTSQRNNIGGSGVMNRRTGLNQRRVSQSGGGQRFETTRRRDPGFFNMDRGPVRLPNSGDIGFLVDNPKDCLVTQWTHWSQPFGFGSIKRERKILRYPENGGRSCPDDLMQIKETAQRPTVRQTARAMTDHFMVQNRRDRVGRQIGQLRDLLIIMDSSGSVSRRDFNVAKFQLARLLGMLCPGPDPFNGNQRAALIQYSNVVRDVFDFDDKNNTAEVQRAVRNMRYMGKATCTGSVLEHAKDRMLTMSRGMRDSPAVKPEVLILTDGRSNCGEDTMLAAEGLRDKADVYALTIGEQNYRGRRELSTYPSEPVNQHLFTVRGYRDLRRLVNYIQENLKRIRCAPFDLAP